MTDANRPTIRDADRLSPRVTLVCADAFAWLADAPEGWAHAIVTDPPYGLDDFEPDELAKLDAGRGGLWRIPPALGGAPRRPVPRFTVLGPADRDALAARFLQLGALALRALRPGGHLWIASNPLLSSGVFAAVEAAGLEKRAEIVRLVQTLRGGDRPKGAHDAFPDVTVMPRSAWEPWGLFRKPFQGTVADCLRAHGTGGLRRESPDRPFTDVIPSERTPRRERALVDHPSLKPQSFMRRIVRASLPLGAGVVVDPFAGAGSTLAAAEALGVEAIGIERDPVFVARARAAFAGLAALEVDR